MKQIKAALSAICASLSCMAVEPIGAELFHHEVDHSKIKNNSYVWQVAETQAFDELVVSWNAMRPEEGEYAILVSVKIKDWSDELLYARWAKSGQCTYTTTSSSLLVRTNEDTIELLSGAKATGFSVKVEAKDGATLDALYALHASACSPDLIRDTKDQTVAFRPEASVYVPVPGRSQIALKHPRSLDICSPTSTAAVTSYLSGKDMATLGFAQNVWDAGFDIYGNWIFNVAQSFYELKNPWRVYMARLDSFEPIYNNLKKGVPTVVSVRGPLTGTLHPYKKGHLLVVTGYDSESDRIRCMDPAYNEDSDTLVSYDRDEFLRAWNRRGQIAYMFQKG